LLDIKFIIKIISKIDGIQKVITNKNDKIGKIKKMICMLRTCNLSVTPQLDYFLNQVSLINIYYNSSLLP